MHVSSSFMVNVLSQENQKERAVPLKVRCHTSADGRLLAGQEEQRFPGVIPLEAGIISAGVA